MFWNSENEVVLFLDFLEYFCYEGAFFVQPVLFYCCPVKPTANVDSIKKIGGWRLRIPPRFCNFAASKRQNLQNHGQRYNKFWNSRIRRGDKNARQGRNSANLRQIASRRAHQTAWCLPTGIGRIARGQFRDTSQNCIGAACAKSGVQREMGHQVARHVLHAVASAEIDAWQGTDDLTVLITVWSAT